VRWDESQHPRREDGRFRRKGTADWSRLVSERLGAPGGHVDRVEGRDLLGELTDADWGAMRHLAPGVFDFEASKDPAGDRALGQIWARQGFDGLPRVVDEATLQGAIDSGWMSIWRAVGGHTEVQMSASEVAEQYRSGPPRPGFGGYGNGTYFAPDTARDGLVGYYASGGEAWQGSEGALIHAALSPSARTITWDELMPLMRQHGLHIADLPEDEREWTTRQWVLQDPGRFAAALGYDAILYTQGPTVGEIVVLNRTALMIAEAADG